MVLKPQQQDHRLQELGDFLRTRRARLTPEEVGLPKGTRRKTPGLRRAEVAQLVGVSTATIYRLCTRGDVQHFRISNAIRVCADDLAAFLKARRARR